MHRYEPTSELNHELLCNKIEALDAELRRIQKRRMLGRTAVTSVLALVVGISLLAQTSTGPITLQSLSRRIDDLEQRVTSDEASGTNIPDQAGNGTPSGSSGGSSASAAQADQALAKRVGELEQEVADLKAEPTQQRFVNDELNIAHLQQAVTALQGQMSSHSASSTNANSGGSTPSAVKAPFQVIGSNGRPIFTVEEDGGEPFLHMENSAGTQVIRIASRSGDGIIRISDGSNKNWVYVGANSGHALVSLSDEGDHVSLSRPEATGALGVYLGRKAGKNDVALDLENGVGNLHLFNDSGQVGFFSASKNGSEIQLNAPGGSKAFIAGVSESGSGPFARINDTNGSALIGSPSGRPFGFRLYGPDGKTPAAGMMEDAQGNSSIALASQGKQRVSMAAQGAAGIIGVLDGGGQKYLAVLTSHPDGGEVYVANSAGQIAGGINVDPATNAGEVLVYSSGGTPLGLMSVQGNHGDVQLNSSDKQVDVWKFLLLPR